MAAAAVVAEEERVNQRGGRERASEIDETFGVTRSHIKVGLSPN